MWKTGSRFGESVMLNTVSQVATIIGTAIALLVALRVFGVF
jgi:hypothetical protein